MITIAPRRRPRGRRVPARKGLSRTGDLWVAVEVFTAKLSDSEKREEQNERVSEGVKANLK